MSPGIGAPNRGSGIKEDTIVLNRQLGSWELAKCCCLLSLLSGNKAICQTIVGGKLFLIRPLASERPSWRASKTSRHSRKLSVPLKQTWKWLNSGTRRHPSVRLWTQPTHQTQSVLRNEKTNTGQLTLHFMVWRAAFGPFTGHTGPSSPKSPPPRPLTQVWLSGGTFAEPVPEQDAQLEGRCSAVRNVHSPWKYR